uniref:Uncharacterized protein n=1 Tax=Anguilla anguilla TaxID=7936 RepID=A0A0E9XFI0_ANGAN
MLLNLERTETLRCNIDYRKNTGCNFNGNALFILVFCFTTRKMHSFLF